MTWLAPGYLLAGALGGLGVVLLHFIVTREPRTQPLPTARFAPDAAALARPRALRPNDPLLMLLRALLLVMAGAALARPAISPSRRPVIRIVLADRSAAVQDSAEVRDSVARIVRTGDSVIPFDSAGISAALIRALRAASRLRARAESLELVLVSPVASGQLDNATDSIRALWPGALRIVRVRARARAAPDSSLVFDGPAEDPLRLAFAGRIAPSGGVRLVRDGSDTASAPAGQVIVRWPASQESPGTGDAVTTGDITVVAPFARDGGSVRLPPGARVVARWADGAPAAWEESAGGGCNRTVRIAVPSGGDLVLTPRFARLAARLTAPCGPALDLSPAAARRIAALEGGGGLAASAVLAAPGVVRTPLMRWLLLFALLLALAEWLVRRRSIPS